MNRINYRLPAAGLSALLLIGCGDGSSASSDYASKKPQKLTSALVQPGQEPIYFPFAAGNQWTFESLMTRVVNGRQESPVKQTITYKISQVTDGPNGAKDAWMIVRDAENEIDRQIWRVDKTGLYQLGLGLKLNRFSSPQLIVPFPVKVGGEFKWKGSIPSDKGEVRTATNNGTVAGEEPIDTLGNTYNAIAIESKGVLTGPTSKSDVASRLWLIPGIGIGRYRQEAIGEITAIDKTGKKQKVKFGLLQMMKLKSYSLKK